MSLDDALKGLQSQLPSERMRAAQWLLQARGLDAESDRLLVQAISAEQVPRIKSVLSAALAAHRAGSRPPDQAALGGGDPEVASLLQVLQDLGGIVRHELQPAIGWLRFGAHAEIPDFETSETHKLIEALRRRVDGVVALAEAHRLPVFQPTSLGELLAACVPPDVPKNLFSIETGDELDVVYTDRGLFTLIVANAFQNAVDAVLGMPKGDGQVFVAVGLSERDFWLTISNAFAGASFELQNVVASGVTSKLDHRGLGARVMRLAAARLNYDLDLKAAGGVATFSLRGRRRQ